MAGRYPSWTLCIYAHLAYIHTYPSKNEASSNLLNVKQYAHTVYISARREKSGIVISLARLGTCTWLLSAAALLSSAFRGIDMPSQNQQQRIFLQYTQKKVEECARPANGAPARFATLYTRCTQCPSGDDPRIARIRYTVECYRMLFG